MSANFDRPMPIMFEQIAFHDRFNSLAPSVQHMIERDYSVYRNDLASVLLSNLEKIKDLFEEETFRPKDATAFTMGMLFILQCRDNSSIDEVLMRANTDVAYQYVLLRTSNNKKPVLTRSYYTLFLKKMAEYNAKHDTCLMETIFTDFTDSAASEMCINLHQDLGDVLQTRIDSMMIDTPAEHLTRAGIIYRTNAMCLDLKASIEGLGVIPVSLHHYLEESDENAVIYHNTGEKKIAKLEGLLKDSLKIKTLLSGYEDYEEYSLLDRVINEQGISDEDGSISPKADKDISGSSMQSPYYPFGTCRKKYGFHKGDAVCFAEATNGNASLLIEALYGKNITSDDTFMLQHLSRKDQNGPIEVCSCDAGFFSMATAKEAARVGVILVPSALKGSLPKPLLADFELDETGKKLVKCPAGHAPIAESQKYSQEKDSVTAKFDKETCMACEHFGQCPCIEQVKACKVEVSQNAIDLAEQVCAVDSGMFKEFANYRNAIESVPSVMRRTYGFDTLRSMNVTLRKEKIFGACINYNCKKLINFRKNRDSVREQIA